MTPACSAELRNYLEIGMGVATRLSPGAEDVRIEVRCPFMRMKGCLPVVRRRAHVNCALNERRTLSEHSWFSLSERQRPAHHPSNDGQNKFPICDNRNLDWGPPHRPRVGGRVTES